jgi:hypothetical protein
MLLACGRDDVMSLCVSSFEMLAVPTRAADATAVSTTTALTTKKTMA